MPTRRSFLLGGIGTLVLVACSDDPGNESSSTTFGREEVDPPTTTAPTAPTDPNPEAPPTSQGDVEPDEPPAPLEPADPTTLTPADFADITACLLLPEEEEGPYYLDEQRNRRDLVDGRPGHPTRFGLMVVDQQCGAIEGAAVDVWHADAAGTYSGFDGGAGTTFLRGTQVTDRNGIVELASIFPGWYPGRTVHVHVKVHIEDAVVLTTQLVFEDGFADQIYAASPYVERGDRDTRNADDRIIGEFESNGTLFTTRPDGAGLEGTLALAVIGVNPAGASGSNRPLL